jgi:hypothetical protein
VKIKGTCKRDGREFLIEQVVENGGRCPWDGEPFAPDYAITLIEALAEAEEAGARFERALEAVADIRPAFTLDPESLMGGVTTSAARLERNLIKRG